MKKEKKVPVMFYADAQDYEIFKKRCELRKINIASKLRELIFEDNLNDKITSLVKSNINNQKDNKNV